MEFGDTEEGFARGRPRLRGPLLLRGQHAPADRAARRGRRLRPRRQAHALVLDADAALRPPRAREGARDAAARDPRHRDAQRRRLRRQVRSVQPRDRRRAPLARHRPARQDLPDARGGLLLPPRPPPDADEGPDRSEAGRRDHGDALPDGAGRRRLRLLRRRLHVLHGRAPDRDLPGARRTASTARASSRTSRRAAPSAATARPSRASPSRSQLDKIACDLGIDPAEIRRRHLHPAELAHGELPPRRLDRPRRVHRQGRRGLGLEEAARQAAARAAAWASPARPTSAARACRSTGTRCRSRASS